MSIRSTVVFCDDIRIESSGKQILLGVYPTDIVPQKIPTTMRLSVWIQVFKQLAVGKHTFKVLLVTDVGKGVLDGEMEVVRSLPTEIPVVLAMPPVAIKLEQYGKIRCLLGFDGEEPEEVGAIPVNPPDTKPT